MSQLSQSQSFTSTPDILSDAVTIDYSSPPRQSTSLSRIDPFLHADENPIPSCLLIENIGAIRYVKFPTSDRFDDRDDLNHAKEQFICWWKKTSTGRDITQKKKDYINWGGDSKRRSHAWELFIEIAELSSGKPKVCCTNCKTILNHPSYRRTGTKTMNSHPASTHCGKQTPGPGTRSAKRTLDNYLQTGQV